MPSVRAVTTTADPESPVRDQSDDIVEYWCRENPDVDQLTKGLSVRIRRIWMHLEKSLRRELAAIDMEPWEFEVLLPLRRSETRSASVGELARESQVTAGAMTNRVGRLEERGLVRRDVDPSDRRQVIVSLTEAGLARSDEMIATKIRAEQQTFGALDQTTQERLLADLRTVLVNLEGDPCAERSAG